MIKILQILNLIQMYYQQYSMPDMKTPHPNSSTSNPRSIKGDVIYWASLKQVPVKTASFYVYH